MTYCINLGSRGANAIRGTAKPLVVNSCVARASIVRPISHFANCSKLIVCVSSY
jgi:hypothetical protein